MGQKLKIWATMTSIILLSGMLGFGFSPDAFAKHDPNKNGNGFAQGCDNQGVAKNNPHCEEEAGPIDCDSITEDNAIDAEELQAVRGGSIGENQDIIDLIELGVGDNDNDVIDTVDELAALQGFLPGGTICLIL